MLRKIIIIIVLSITIPFIFSNSTHAALIATSDTLPLRKGDNVLAAAVWNRPTTEGFPGLHIGIRVTVNEKSLVDESTDVKYTVPTRDIPDASNPTGWTQIDFDDSIWHKGKYLIGYGSVPINTQVGSPQQKTLSIYSRAHFKISDPASIENFKLSARYDDGVVIWLNGVEIARSSNFSPTTPHWNSESGGLYGMGYDYESIAWATYRNIIKSAEQSSDDTSLHRLASWLLYQNLELDKALLCAKKATELDPGNLSYRATLGAIYLMVGEEQEALTQFELILYSEPLNHSAWNGVFQIARDRKIDAIQFHGFIDRLKKVFWKDAIQRKRLDNALALFDGKVRTSSYVEENKWAILQASDGFEDRKLAMDRLTSVDFKAFEYVPETPPNFNEKWKKVDDGALDGYVDIKNIIAPPRQKTTGVFALTYINSPEPIDTILHLRGKFSGIKLWVNYGLLYDLPSLSDIAVPVQLEKGSNRILIKLIGKENLGYSLELFEVVPGSLKSLSYIYPYNMLKQPISVNGVLSAANAVAESIWVEDFRAFDPSRYHVQGNAYWDENNRYFVLTKPEPYQVGRIFFHSPFEMRGWMAEFEIKMWGGRGLGSGADGMTFAFVRSYNYPEQNGTDLNFGGEGYGVEFDTYPFGNPGDPQGHHIGLLKDDVYNHLTAVVIPSGFRDDAWHHISIVFTSGQITVYYDGREVISSYSIPNYTVFTGYFGFTAATGGGYEWHVVRNIHIAQFIPAGIDTVDSSSAVPVNQKGQFVLKTGIIHGKVIKTIKTIEIRLPKEFSAPGARVISDVMLEERYIKASSTQVGSVLQIRLEEGITETGMLKVNFEATAGSTTASNVMFFVKLLVEDGTVIRESEEGLGGITVISDAPLPVPRDVVAKTIAGENDVELSWKALDDARIAGYEVLATWNEKDAPKVTKQEVMEVKGKGTTTYQHISAPPDIEISYAVRAVATSSLKSELSQSAITRVGRDKTPPEIMAIKARRIVALETGDSETKIEWNIKGAQDIVQYEIFRSSSPVAKGFNPKKMQKIADVSGEVREYIDKIPRAYIYAVVAIDDGGNRGQFLTFPSMPDDKSIESISIILGDKNISDGIRMPNAGDGQHEPATVAGRLCRKLRANSRYFYFDIDDEYVKDSPHDIYVTVEYFDEGTDSFRIEYNGEITPYTYRQNTGKWNQTTFHLSNPQFRNAQDYLCDFRIVCDSQLAIAKVTVTKNYPLQKFLRAVSYAMIGPLDVTSPESEIDLNKVYTVNVREAIPSIGDRPVKWFESFPYAEYQAVSQNIDMSEMDGTASEGNFYYALTYVKSPGDMLVKLLKYNIANFWINNIPAHDIAQLKKGSNKILLKITSAMSQFRITNLKGDAIKSIRYMSPYDVLKDGKEPKSGVVKGIMLPQDFHVASLPTGTVELSWSPPPSGETPVKGYEIYQVRESGEIKSIARLPKEMTKWESRKWKPWKTMWKFGLRWKYPSLWFGRESFPNIQQKFLVKAIGDSGAESFSPIYKAPFISYQGFWTNISQAAIDKSGNLWWGKDDELRIFDKGKKEWKRTTERGLSDTGIYALVSDAGGHTWVGSSGLYKFDGNEWTKELSDLIADVEIDSDGNPWVQHWMQGVYFEGMGVTHERWLEGEIKRFVNGKWIEIPSPSNQPGNDLSMSINPHAFVLDSNNRLWIGTGAGNIYVYDSADWKTYGSAPQERQGSMIQALAPDDNRKGVWVIFNDTNGLFFYDGRTWEKHLPDKRCRSVVIDSHGDVWTEDMKYDGKIWKNIDGGDRVILDPYGNPWFMTDMNIKKYDGTESFDFPDMMSSFPTCIDVNEQNQLWLGGGREVAVHDGVKVKIYREKDGILGDVTGLVVGKDNTVWVSTQKGFNAFDGEKWVSYKESDGLLSDNVSAITLDKSGVPWVVMSEHEEKTGEKKGKGEAGIATFLPVPRSARQVGEEGNWKSYKIAEGFESSKFTSICVDKDDIVWVGTQDRGLLRFDGKDWTEYNINNGLTSNKIFKILSDSKGKVYALMDRDIGPSPFESRTDATSSSGRPESILDIVVLEGDSWRKVDVPWGSRERLWRESAIIDKEDNLWVGLDTSPGYGLYKYDGITWKTFRPDSSWPSSWIWELAVDKDNNLWTVYEYIGTATLRESPIQYPSRARILLLILPVLAIGTGGALSYRQWKHSQGYIAKVIYHSDIVPSPQKLYITVYSLLKSFQESRMFVLLANQASSDGKEDIAKRIRVFSMLIDYLANLGDALREASEAFADASGYEWGEEIHSQYQLLLTACNVKTASQMAAIANNLQKEVENLKQIDDYMLKDSVEAFDMLSKVAEVMRKYERVGLPEDQVVYLNSGITQLEQMQRFIQEQLPMPDKRIFEEITANWRNIIGNALTVLQSSARLRFELKTKELARIEESVLLLGLENVGRGHAENVKVKLLPSEGYELIDEQKEVSTILQRRKVEVEFRIRLNLNELSKDEVPQLRASFEIRYDDAQQEGKLEKYADIFSLQMVAEREFRELMPNPYIAGPPLKDSATFFGREDVFEFIRQTLQGEGQRNIIILYGQRRTGKTSIMYQLKHRLGDDFLPVLIDLQGIGYEGMDSLLYAMALNIYRALRERGIEIERPKFEDFSVQPTVRFRYDFLEAVLEKLQGRFLILMIDEFELLEERVKEGVLDRNIFDYLRNLMQHTEGLGFIFSGSRAIETMASDYWSVLFNIALYREISFLKPQEVERLIREPVRDYFDYDPLAVEKIIRTTQGHPYFTQLFCNILVNYRNERRKNYITIQDVNAVIDEVVQTGRVHLEYLWEESSEEEQLFLLLLSMALQREGLVTLSTLRELVSDFNLKIDLLSAAEKLSRRHIIQQEAGHYRFSLELMHHWIRQHKNIQEFLEAKGGEVNGDNAKF